MSQKQDLKKLLTELEEKCPIINQPVNERDFSIVRRMKAEKELNIPIKRRIGCVISVKTRQPANKMNEQEWEEFYKELCDQLKQEHADMYGRLFSKGH
ncbi:hypothetical protein KJ969_01740 [Patescibacteria group bacterium]|nr:hypothetical protein [Patescibacteria group bacterium]MBU1921793.1 hypothetical protein [Patescibacteria group bacterium]